MRLYYYGIVIYGLGKAEEPTRMETYVADTFEEIVELVKASWGGEPQKYQLRKRPCGMGLGTGWIVRDFRTYPDWSEDRMGIRRIMLNE